MKRLLAYLFLVLGLGLVVNVNANEKILPDTYPENQYEFAIEFLKIGDYNNAEKAFREFVITNPNHKLAGNAQYWYAETFRVRQLWKDAASAYLEGYQKYPKSEKAAINLLKLGVSLVEIGQKDQGCLQIVGVKKQYPNATQSVLQRIKDETRRYECKQDTQIAKAEPSQTQEAAKKEECIEGDCVNGYGTFTWPSGNKYVGEFIDGKGNGQGTLTFADGHKYVGEFKDGDYHGQGTFTWPDGAKYVGEFKDDLPLGQGTFTWPNGNKYVGEYKDGKRTGIGTFTWLNGNKYVGEFKDGKEHGQGTLTYADGTIEKGIFKNGKLDKLDTTSDDIAKIEEEKKKIAEEKRKIEEEKRKIAEAKKKQEEEEKKRKEANEKLYIIGSGTGFFVNSNGYAASNEHVVGACREVATKIKGEIIIFKIIATDITNDIGLIKTDFNNINYLNINPSGADIGEDIVAFGYPLSDKLSSSVKLTRGIVSSLSGPGNNYSLIQIDAAIQPGNSGGPVLNYNSQVVGIASAGLKKVKMLVEEEYIPENVNFAVAASSLSNFLKANNVIIGSEENKVNNTKELAKIGIPATIQLYCLNTKAAHTKNKKNNRYADAMLEKVIDLK